MDSHANCAHGPGGHAAALLHGRTAAEHQQGTRALRIALTLTALFMVAEVVGGIVSNSLALLADAGHMLTDVGALGLSLFVAWFSRQRATPEKTFGYLRWEILAAFLNGATLLALSVWIVVEAVLRLRHPEAVGSGVMLAIAVGGLVVNVGAALALHPVGKTSLNVRGAYLHVLGDLLASVATVIAALVIRYTGWLPADPITSILSTLLIARGAWRLVSESVDVLLEGTPRHISVQDVRAQLCCIPAVEHVHDLHVWTVTSGVVAMSAHAVVREPERHQGALEEIQDAMAALGIHHVTVQLERSEMSEREAHLHP